MKTESYELAYTNLDEAKNASDIDLSLSNLKWKNPFFEGKVEDEIK